MSRPRARKSHAHPKGSSRRRAIVAALAGPVVIAAALAFGNRAPPSTGAIDPSAAIPQRTTLPSGGSADPTVGSPTGQPTPTGPLSSSVRASAQPSGGDIPGRFPGGLLIADRGNGRLIVVTEGGQIVWSFPGRGSLPRGQRFSADDAFLAPDGKTIVANDEAHQVIDRIDIATRKIIWQYGRYDRPGAGPGQLHTPDDAYPLANGDVIVADIRNCRILEIAPTKRIVKTWGRAGRCIDRPPAFLAEPNGDTPLPDGGLLITEITGSRVIRIGPDGHVRFDIHVPVRYPSDAQLAADGSILVVDYATPGAIVRVSPSGRVLWRYAVRSGPGRLDHPSLAMPLPDGTIALNDDERQRVVIIDPRTNRIVWQYGVTDRRGRTGGRLSTPDGIDVLPPGTIPGVG
jgi:outer membrane protein assembly factor BamB